MKLCKKCGNKFGSRILIEGKVRILARRKYCLSCSPFGSHNTINFNKDPTNTSDIRCVCTKCNKPYIYKRNGKNTANSTAVCAACYVAKRRDRNRRKIVKYKGGKCVVCGYSKCSRALVFHHMDSKNKYDNISAMISHNRSLKTIMMEADKCILICNRCHEEHNDGMLDLTKYWHNS
jgi:hypothetical protein